MTENEKLLWSWLFYFLRLSDVGWVPRMARTIHIYSVCHIFQQAGRSTFSGGEEEQKQQQAK